MDKKRIVITFLCLFFLLFSVIPRVVKAATNEERTSSRKVNGTFVVGVDIPQGEYVISYYGRDDYSKENGVYDSSYVIYKDASSNGYENRLEDGRIYVHEKVLRKGSFLSKKNIFSKNQIREYNADLLNLKDGQMIELKYAQMYPAELRRRPNLKKLVSGTYKVGRDIPAGKYKVKEFDAGSNEPIHSLWVLNNVDPTVDINESSIKMYQDYSEEKYPEIIKLENDQYVYFSDLLLKLDNK